MRLATWDAAPTTCPDTYRHRARQVYWDRSFPACRAKGPSNAECLLNPGHPGDHFGNGFDPWGPKGATWWPRRSRQQKRSSRERS